MPRRPAGPLLCIWLCLAVSAVPRAQTRSLTDTIAALSADDPAARARAACEIRAGGDEAAHAIAPLVRLLADASPVERTVCREHWRRSSEPLTTPGELAAAALVAIGSRAFDPVVRALQQAHWVARANAAWALGALDDPRAGASLLEALDDREPGVRAQAAWALGALDDPAALERLTGALKDADARVREQAAWALGAIGDSRATSGLIVALKDVNADVRRQAAWALGAIAR